MLAVYDGSDFEDDITVGQIECNSSKISRYRHRVETKGINYPKKIETVFLARKHFLVQRAGFEPANPYGKGFLIGRLKSKRRS